MSRARMIYEDLTKGDGDARWERIERLVTDRETESLWLDFKEVRQPTALPNEDYLKDKLARAISGYANTEGGVLVYGIYAKDGKKGEPDAAEKITAIEKPGRFRAALEKLAVTLTDPVVGGIVVKEIVKPSTDEGVVVVFVPESNGAPHRVVSAGADVNEKYMMRTATSVMVMPHRLLADRFARTAPPALRMIVRVADPPGSPTRVEFWLKNIGRGAARQPAILFPDLPPNFEPSVGTRLTSRFVFRKNDVGDRKRLFLVEPHEDVIIYPGMEQYVATLPVQGGQSFTVQIPVVLHALDMQPVVGTIDVLVNNSFDQLNIGRSFTMNVSDYGQ